jgi:hypothetical protein
MTATAALEPFAVNPQRLLTICDQQNSLWRSFLQALIDNGASDVHLDALVKNTLQGRGLFNEFARKVIGPIWDRVGQKCDLGPIDFAKPLKSFAADFPQVGVNSHVYTGSPEWLGSVDTAPDKPFDYYTLIHFQRPVHLKDIYVSADDLGKAITAPFDLGVRVEHAGIRELIAYVARMEASDFSHCTICAAGSWQKENKTPPRLLFAGEEESWAGYVSWYSMPGGEAVQAVIRTDHFFLVRVHASS